MTDRDHDKWMTTCLELAQRGAGRVSPNPMVGAVLVGTDGTLLGQGWHREFGGPHAEVHAIQDAERRYGDDALTNATLYVNLEPCSHHGKTPPCVDLILEMGIPRVVVGTSDPSPQVGGEGFRRLRENGVEVTEGVLAAASGRLNEAFIHHVQTGRPLVTLKMAQTLDARLAGASGESRWISGEPSRRLVHHWRATTDGVLVGTGTALRDDPALTVRHVEGRHPVRIVLDRTGRLPGNLQLFTDEHAGGTVVLSSGDAVPAYEDELARRGGRVIRVPSADGMLDLKFALAALGSDDGPLERPLQSILVEGGAGIAASLLRSDLVDRLFLFVAPKLLGVGPLSIDGIGLSELEDAYVFEEYEWERVGEDMLFKGYRRRL